MWDMAGANQSWPSAYLFLSQKNSFLYENGKLRAQVLFYTPHYMYVLKKS